MRPFPVLLAAAVWLAAAAPAAATTVEPPEFGHLVHSSDYVVRGRVVAVRHEVRVREGRELPFTLVELEVSEVVAGTPPERVVLSMLGGPVADGELVVEGVPRFTVGDEDILFVRDNGLNFHPLNAVPYGRYPVLRDKKLGREYVARANRVPLSATAEVALPLAEGKLAQELRRRIRPDDALTPAEFIRSIRAVRAGHAPLGEEAVHAR
jgi:hypothetical protein